MPSRTTEKVQANRAKILDGGHASGAEAASDEGRVRQVRAVTESRARRRRARQAGAIVVKVVVQIHLWATIAAPLALLDAMFRGAPEGQERWGGPAPITMIIVLALMAVGAGVLSVSVRRLIERKLELIDVVALHLLERHFAPGLYEEILEAVG